MTTGRVQGILRGTLTFVGLVAVCAALGYGAWAMLTRPPERAPRISTMPVAPSNDSLGFFSIAAEGVELEVLAPDGRRTSTNEAPSAPTRIDRSETQIDCPGVTLPGGREAACTASIKIGSPAPGDYLVIARSTQMRAPIVSVGWATTSQVQRGAFSVPVQVARDGASAFGIIVARDNVSRRTEPKPYTP